MGADRAVNRRDVFKAAALGVAAMSFAAPAISESIGGRSFDNKKTALIFIEFQNQWLDSASPLNGLMQDRALFSAAVENSARVLRKARERQANVVHAGLSLVADPDYLIFAGGKDKSGLRGAIPKAGTWRNPDQVAFPAPFSPQTGEFVVAGRSGASVITNSNLDPYLRNNRIEHIYLLGFALHVCVESTMRHAHDLGYDVTVVRDAAPAFTAEQQRHVLAHVIHHFGSSITSEELIGMM